MTKTKAERCQALGRDGRRCRKDSANLVAYHGDGELYDGSRGIPTWVAVNLCRDHEGHLKVCEVMWREGIKLRKQMDRAGGRQ